MATTIVLWRIYIQRAGQILAEAVTKSRHPASIGRSAADTHLVMVTGLSAVAVGYELIVEHPTEAPPWAWVAVVLGGPALFLAGRSRFEYEVFRRVSPSRWIGVLALLASAPLLIRAPALAASATAVGVLAAVAVADARRARGHPPEPPAPPF
ncbi:low temperature requirement protein A [Micromonospora musae]|uniref:low temperature requirement protein A n=1 Tax=Micromonospora musae TaxID=1894970 RepID=UPI0034235FEC